jgi:hypothetical protein
MAHGRDGTEGAVGVGARRPEPLELYELLEISPRASQDVIQAAYRVLARNHHPDVNTSANADQRIRQLNAAYFVLSDPARRARYDLESLRARRHDRLTHTSVRSEIVAGPVASRTRALPDQGLQTSRRPADDRLVILNGQLAMGLLLVACLAVILLTLVWTSLDAIGSEHSGTFISPPLEYTPR